MEGGGGILFSKRFGFINYFNVPVGIFVLEKLTSDYDGKTNHIQLSFGSS